MNGVRKMDVVGQERKISELRQSTWKMLQRNRKCCSNVFFDREKQALRRYFHCEKKYKRLRTFYAYSYILFGWM